MSAAMQIHPLITDSDSLSSLCQRLSRSDFVAVDTEFMRENTYWPDLCLVQIGNSEEAAAIPSRVTRRVLPTMPPESRIEAECLASHSSHCFSPAASTSSCSALGNLRNRATSSGFMV